MTLATVQARIARLSASLQGSLGPRVAYPRRRCDECHRVLGLSRYEGGDATCRQCGVELATPARPR